MILSLGPRSGETLKSSCEDLWVRALVAAFEIPLLKDRGGFEREEGVTSTPYQACFLAPFLWSWHEGIASMYIPELRRPLSSGLSAREDRTSTYSPVSLCYFCKISHCSARISSRLTWLGLAWALWNQVWAYVHTQWGSFCWYVTGTHALKFNILCAMHASMDSQSLHIWRDSDTWAEKGE